LTVERRLHSVRRRRGRSGPSSFSSGPARFGPSLSTRRCTVLPVDADRPLKELFRLRPRDLLALVGDAGATLISTQVAELQSLSRRVDTVLRLRRDRERYIRHLEFEMRFRERLLFRCFDYATRLVTHFRLPVLTTVVLVKRSGPPELAHQEVLGGRVVHERRFDVVRLWELDPERTLRLGPGAAALIGAAETTTLPLLKRAARKIQRETEGVVQSDLLFILQALSPRRYTARKLAIPRETIMASSLWAEAVREGRKEGREKGRKEGREKGRQEGHREGRIAGAREVCLEFAKQHHPKVADHVAPLIEVCSDVERLHEWALHASRLPDPEFLRLVTEQSGSTSKPAGRRRAPRPSRKVKPKRSR
jgi:predicted transposase YdaD